MGSGGATTTIAFGIQTYVPQYLATHQDHHTNSITERHNSQMDNPRLILLHLLRLVRRRSHPRKAAAQERATITRIPSRMSPFTPPHFYISLTPKPSS
jgi:hypothetical protein